MKILGFEISKASTAKEPTSTIRSVTQETKPSVPLKKAKPYIELGDSGTKGLSGIIVEEYNPQLQGLQGVRVYDQMRKSDGTVRAAVLACTLPIRRAKWFVNSVSEDPKEIEIANMVEHALFDWLEDMTWDDVVRQALLFVPFGVMVFEKVYGTKEVDGKTYITLKKLAPRLPTSIQQWELPDKTFGIQQIRQDGFIANIPGSKLVTFINELEGTNWWGTSMLRAAYKHWYFKDNFYKIDAIAFERQGLGIPKITMPVGYTESDQTAAKIAMKNLRANEDAFLILPPNYTAEFMNMGASSTRDPEKSINHHNKEILQSVLAQFLELGQTSSSSGSRATSEDHSDLFLKAMDAIANTLTSEINKRLIPELVDLNFNDVTTYPKLDFSGISKTDVQGIAEVYSSLVTSGGIKPIASDEQYLRAMIGLPARTQDDEDPDSEDIKDGVDVDVPKKNTKKKEKTEIEEEEIEAHDHSACRGKKIKMSEGENFTSWRPLTFAEEKVTFDRIEKAIEDIEGTFAKDAKEALKKAKDVYVNKLQSAMSVNDMKAIQEIEIKFVAEYKSILKDAMKKAYEYGKNNVSTEMKVAVPPNVAASIANIDLMADTIANKTASDIETKAKIAISNNASSGVSVAQAIGAVDLLLDEAIDKAVRETSGIVVVQSLNNGRNDVFQRNKDMIHALQRSEVLDYATCNFCLSMDGRVIDADDYWARTSVYHTNCRGIWVEILKDEENPPEITGIPDSLGDYFTGIPNGLVQPPKPTTLPGTLADDFAKENRKKK